MTETENDRADGQQGQIFAITLVVLAVAVLLSVPVLQLVSSVLHRSFASRTTVRELYSVDAGTEDAIWRVDNDSTFLANLLSGQTQTYNVVVNQNNVDILVEPNSPSVPPPPPVVIPPAAPGIDVRMYTQITPSVYDVNNPPPSITMDVYLENLGAQQGQGSNATVSQIIVVLPKGFVYAGNLQPPVNLEDSNGLPFVLGPPLQEGIDPIPNARYLWGWNPYLPPPNDCADPNFVRNDGVPPTSTTPADGNSDWQRIQWQWASVPASPRIQQYTTAHITFDIQLANPFLGYQPDNPWWEVQQNFCHAPNDPTHSQLEPGIASGILVFLTYRIKAHQGGTTLWSDVLITDTTQILGQQYK